MVVYLLLMQSAHNIWHTKPTISSYKRIKQRQTALHICYTYETQHWPLNLDEVVSKNMRSYMQSCCVGALARGNRGGNCKMQEETSTTTVNCGSIILNDGSSCKFCLTCFVCTCAPVMPKMQSLNSLVCLFHPNSQTAMQLKMNYLITLAQNSSVQFYIGMLNTLNIQHLYYSHTMGVNKLVNK